jgi:hypothetical protein
MPKISEFDGMRIYMNWKDVDHHHLPHIHVYYNQYHATFELNGELLAGEMPRQKTKLIRQWCLENPLKLHYAWQKAIKSEEVPWIN